MRYVLGKVCRENHKTHFMFNIFFFLYSAVFDYVVYYFSAGQAADDGMSHAHCMLDT
jgi:hypothetical protein